MDFGFAAAFDDIKEVRTLGWIHNFLIRCADVVGHLGPAVGLLYDRRICTFAQLPKFLWDYRADMEDVEMSLASVLFSIHYLQVG